MLLRRLCLIERGIRSDEKVIDYISTKGKAFEDEFPFPQASFLSLVHLKLIASTSAKENLLNVV